MFFTEDQAESLKKTCYEHGFDIFHTFHTSWYNDLIEKEGHAQSGVLKKLPDDTKDHNGQSSKLSNHNAFLIGNTKYIWSFFIEWLSKEYKKEQEEGGSSDGGSGVLETNPFDNYCQEIFKIIIQEYREKNNYISDKSDNNNKNDDDDISFDIYFTNGKKFHNKVVNDESEDFLVSTQRIATLTGSYWLDDVGSRLCVHPEYGTWHSFRVVIVMSCKSSSSASSLSSSSSVENNIRPALPPPLSCPVAQHEIDDAKCLMEYAIKKSSSSTSTSIEDEMEELKISSNTKKQILENDELTQVTNKVKPSALTWINLRDALSLGRKEYRYEKEQLCYHYTRDSDILKKLMVGN